MVEQDTIRLLRECDAGVRMGISSIEDVEDRVQSRRLKDYLSECKREHEKLQKEILVQLDQYHDEGKGPNPMLR